MKQTRPGDDAVTSAAAARRRATRRRLRLACSVVAPLLIATAAAPASTASAARHDGEQGRRPVFREEIDDRFVEHPDPYALDVCGVEVQVDGHVWGHFVQYGDLTARRHLNIEITWSDPHSGNTLLVERDAETFFERPISETIDEHAGTITAVYESTITGLPLKGIVPGEGVIIRDAGWITERVTVVTDLATGEVITAEGQFADFRGPHPFAELTPPERDAIFCDALTG